MLIGDHPCKGPGDEIDNPECPHSWVFACWASGCCARYAVCCSGSPHVLLSVAIERAEWDGWALRERGAGWHCPVCLEQMREREHEHARPEPPAVGATCANRGRKRVPLLPLQGGDQLMEPLFTAEGM